MLAAEMISSIPRVKVIHVIAHKATLRVNATGLRGSQRTFYNFTTKLLLERVAYQAKSWPGGARFAIVRADAVKNVDHESTKNYLDYIKWCGDSKAPWEYIKWPPIWRDSQYDGIQLADIYVGMLGNALDSDPEDVEQARPFLTYRHQLYRYRGECLGAGIKIIGSEEYVTNRKWWQEVNG